MVINHIARADSWDVYVVLSQCFPNIFIYKLNDESSDYIDKQDLRNST